MTQTPDIISYHSRNNISKYLGCLLGGAVGDALGYPVEFLTIQDIRDTYGQNGITDYQLTNGIARISDDTQMTLFTANGLLNAFASCYDRGVREDMLGHVAEAYADWLFTQGFREEFTRHFRVTWISAVPELHAARAPGTTCITALRTYQLCKGKKIRTYGTLENPFNYSKGCGGVMRVAPVGLYFQRKACGKTASDIAAITHGHPLGCIPAAALAVIIHDCSTTALPLETIIRQAISDTADYFTAETNVEKQFIDEFVTISSKAVELANSDTDPLSAIESLGEGWVAEEALAIAIYCSLKYKDDFTKAVIAAVNHSGDSDSTGSITGNILGSYLGVEKIPAHFLEPLELRSVIEELAYDLCDNEEMHTPGGEGYKEWVTKYIHTMRLPTVCNQNDKEADTDFGKENDEVSSGEEQRDAEEQYTLGVQYQFGQGVKKDIKKAVYWYTKSAEQGHAEAQTILGAWYQFGWGVEKDFKKSVYWYTKAAEQGNADAQNNLGKCYRCTGDTRKLVYWYTRAAEQGYAAAQNNLGECYHFGRGVEEDCTKAVYWYTQAAEQGYAEAQINLGRCYQFGWGVEKDFKKAVYWYTQAAEQGNRDAQGHLGIYYYRDGVEKDIFKAAYWFVKEAEQWDGWTETELRKRRVDGYFKKIKAVYRRIVEAEQGNATAQNILGTWYQFGRSIDNSFRIEKDFSKAVCWYTKAAEQGNADAQINLGRCYQFGRGVEKDFKKAVHWYTQAAEQGVLWIQYDLGEWYQSGQWVEKDLKKAAYWYTKAAEQKYVKAQNNLGECYQFGWGVEKDFKKAVYWYMQAAEKKSVRAQHNLGRCYQFGWGVEKDVLKAAEWFSKAENTEKENDWTIDV